VPITGTLLCFWPLNIPVSFDSARALPIESLWPPDLQSLTANTSPGHLGTPWQHKERADVLA